MATPRQFGLAQLYGITGVATISVFANLTFQTQSAKLQGKADVKFLKDHIGYDVSASAVNEMTEATLEFNITADTKAHAIASATILTVLSKITLATYDVTALNGDWLYIGDQTIDLANVECGKMSIPIRKYNDPTQNAAMVVAAS